MRYTAVGWRVKARGMLGIASVSPAREEVEEEVERAGLEARAKVAKALARAGRVNKLSSHYRRHATRYTLVKPRKQMSVKTKLKRWGAASTVFARTDALRPRVLYVWPAINETLKNFVRPERIISSKVLTRCNLFCNGLPVVLLVLLRWRFNHGTMERWETIEELFCLIKKNRMS